jgi:hypothetical protein
MSEGNILEKAHTFFAVVFLWSHPPPRGGGGLRDDSSKKGPPPLQYSLYRVRYSRIRARYRKKGFWGDFYYVREKKVTLPQN